MPILRLAYVTQFMIGLIAVFTVWGQVGGQSHLDMMPWYVKLGMGGGVALAAVKATRFAVDGQQAWNGGSLKWFGIMVALIAGCGMASYYFHIYGEADEDGEEETVTSQAARRVQHTPLRLTISG